MTPVATFDRLARSYRLLEWIAFAGALERARFAHVDALAGCTRVVVMGEGDGRFLERAVRSFPALRVDCVDASAAMLGRAARRLRPEERARVDFIHADARLWSAKEASYDAAVTLFFLDCFEQGEAEALMERISCALKPEARWLWADFAVPAGGWRRARARLWLSWLYLASRWTAGLRTRRLPELEAVFRAKGFAPERGRELQAGLLRTRVWRRAASG